MFPFLMDIAWRSVDLTLDSYGQTWITLTISVVTVVLAWLILRWRAGHRGVNLIGFRELWKDRREVLSASFLAIATVMAFVLLVNVLRAIVAKDAELQAKLRLIDERCEPKEEMLGGNLTEFTSISGDTGQWQPLGRTRTISVEWGTRDMQHCEVQFNLRTVIEGNGTSSVSFRVIDVDRKVAVYNSDPVFATNGKVAQVTLNAYPATGPKTYGLEIIAVGSVRVAAEARYFQAPSRSPLEDLR